MLDYKTIDLDVEQVRQQMAGELDREVTELEVRLWLREQGFHYAMGIWYADRSRGATCRSGVGGINWTRWWVTSPVALSATSTVAQPGV